MEIYEFEGYKNNNIKELEQITRVKDILVRWFKGNNLPFLYFFQNVNYYNEGLGLQWNHKDWNGEVDLIAISQHHFIIFELKNINGVIKGESQGGRWEIKNSNHRKVFFVKNYFLQCSRMKLYFSQKYYPEKIVDRLKIESKLRPDILLVFKNGANLENVNIMPPHRISIEDYNNILNIANTDEKKFMEENFRYDTIQKKYKCKNVRNTNNKYLKEILIKCNYRDRISRWFHVLTENAIMNLLPELGSDSFYIDKNILNIMIKDFNLILNNKYVA